MIGIALQFLSGTFRRALTWATQSIAHMLAVALVCALAWGYVEHRAAAKWKRVLASTETAYRNAQVDAKLAQDALNSSISARYRAEAEKTDHVYQKARAGALSRADSYIRANRLRCPVAGGTGPASPAAESDSSSFPENAPADALVAVTERNVRACSIAAPYGMKAHEWATGMVDAGLAEWAAD